MNISRNLIVFITRHFTLPTFSRFESGLMQESNAKLKSVYVTDSSVPFKKTRISPNPAQSFNVKNQRLSYRLIS